MAKLLELLEDMDWPVCEVVALEGRSDDGPGEFERFGIRTVLFKDRFEFHEGPDRVYFEDQFHERSEKEKASKTLNEWYLSLPKMTMEKICEIEARQTAAATRIQAIFRGWRFRLRTLSCPHTEVGAAYLKARALKYCGS